MFLITSFVAMFLYYSFFAMYCTVYMYHVCNADTDILLIVELQSILAALILERSHHMDLCCKPGSEPDIYCASICVSMSEYKDSY